MSHIVPSDPASGAEWDGLTAGSVPNLRDKYQAFREVRNKEYCPWPGAVQAEGWAGLWGWQEPRAGWGWWDSPTSVGGAVLHPSQQLREENVLSRLLRRVPEQDLKERNIPERSIPERSIPEDPSVTLRCHTGLVAQTAPPEQPRGSWDLIMALRVPVGWGNCPGSAP